MIKIKYDCNINALNKTYVYDVLYNSQNIYCYLTDIEFYGIESMCAMPYDIENNRLQKILYYRRHSGGRSDGLTTWMNMKLENKHKRVNSYV